MERSDQSAQVGETDQQDDTDRSRDMPDEQIPLGKDPTTAWSEQDSSRPSRAPDVVGEAEAVMRCTASQMLTFFMDVERYRTVDDKIGRIAWVQRSPDGREVTFRFTPHLGPVPPLMQSTQTVVRHGNRAASIRPVPSFTDRLADFRGSVECWPVENGVRVRRRLEFWLNPVLRPVLGPALRRFLARDVPAELDAARRVLESTTDHSTPTPPGDKP